jgi:superfamily I DNA/RNA helicase
LTFYPARYILIVLKNINQFKGVEVKYSKYQDAIFNFVKNKSGNALINACAGSGKTTTIIESMKFTKGNCIFLAFNKAIANELEKRVPANATAKTLHSLGLSAITKEFGRVQIDAMKIDKIMNGLPALAYVKGMSGTEWKDVNFKRSSIKSIISLVKATMTDFTDNTEVAKSVTTTALNTILISCHSFGPYSKSQSL